MDPDRWQRVTAVFDAALLREPADRAAYVAEACADDPGLVADVQALLAGNERASGASTWSGTGPAGPTAATMPAGARVGPYVIHGLIGIGGMGEVYRARDVKLGREVAIKVLPPAFLADPERLARFEREARVLAALNHPHIGAIYGLEEADSVPALVLELVVGETLADRIARGPMPLKEVLATAGQIAEALDAAHEKGIVHRDLKPANIKITPQGVVKVLDFGIAKLAIGDAASADLTQSPTVTADRTRGGIILGTAAYMSPEQARGQVVDKRTDVWAFGCVLYEMFAGRAAFARDTISDTIVAVLDREPDGSALPPETSSSIRQLIRRCLEKDPRRRLRDIGDARVELEDVTSRVAEGVESKQPVGISRDTSNWSRRRIAVAISAVAVLAAAAASATTWVFERRHLSPIRTTRFSVQMGEGQQFMVPSQHQLAVSPDGGRIVHAANGRLYLRALGDSEARPIPGTDAVTTTPVFSPDGSSVAFFSNSDHTIKRIGLNGGTAVTICSALSFVSGMDWSPQGIVFTIVAGEAGISRVSPNGGKPEVLVRRTATQLPIHPQLIAGGQVLLFTMLNGTGDDGWVDWERHAQIVAQSIRSGERHVLLTGGADARYLPTGHLVYAVGGVLYAVRLDLTRLVIVGNPTRVIEGVRRGVAGERINFSASFPRERWTAQYAVSESGSLMFLPGPDVPGELLSVLVQVDRGGQVVPLLLPPGQRYSPRYSPDGTKVAFDVIAFGQNPQVGIYDLSGATDVRRLTLTGQNRYPVWSPDGVRVAYSSNLDGELGLFSQQADGRGSHERLTIAEQGKAHLADSWSPDGKTLLFEVTDEGNSGSDGTIMDVGQFSLNVLRLPERRIAPFGAVHSRTSIDATFSPDGHWVAYDVDDGSGPRVYVEPFPRTGERYLVTSDRGWNPFWSSGAKELIYSGGPDRFRMMTFFTRPTVAFSSGALLPRGRIFEYDALRRQYDLSPDGKRIIGPVIAPDRSQAIAPTIEVVLNWFEELKAKVP